MLRWTSVIIFVAFATSCSSAKIAYIRGAEGEKVEFLSIFTNEDCDRECQNIMMGKLEINVTRNFMGRRKQVISPGAILVAVNGQVGPNKYFHPLGTYNNTSWQKFRVAVKPGLNQVWIKPSDYSVSPNQNVVFKFMSEAGKKYYVGVVLISSGGCHTDSSWAPIVFEYETYNIVYPADGKLDFTTYRCQYFGP